MQTFLPYPKYTESAACLDNKRLQKQIVECKQIYLSLTQPEYGWKNHPAVKMWAGSINSLILYACICTDEWEWRFKKEHRLGDWFVGLDVWPHDNGESPPWIGDDRLHISHKSNLLRKDPNYYHVFAAEVADDIPYFWPTKNGY